MRPVLLWWTLPGRAEPTPIPSFVALLGLGYAVAAVGFTASLVGRGWSPSGAVGFTAGAVAGCVVGALWFYRAVTLLVARLPLTGRRTGASMVGGILGGCAAGLLLAWLAGAPLVQPFDLGAPWAFVGTAIGRVGCTLAGCDYGRPAVGPWPGVRYPNWSVSLKRPIPIRGAPAFLQHAAEGRVAADAPCSARVHPVPVYWVMTLALGGAWLLTLPLVVPLPGGLGVAPRSLVALALYTALTWLLEPLRGDPIRGVLVRVGDVGLVSVAQAVTLAMTAGAVALWAVTTP